MRRGRYDYLRRSRRLHHAGYQHGGNRLLVSAPIGDPGPAVRQLARPDSVHLACARPPGRHLNYMGKLALLAFAVLLPTLAVGARLLAAMRGYRRLSKLRQSWLGRPARSPPEPVDRSRRVRLRRLRGRAGRPPKTSPAATAKRHHILALRGAYLDTLSQRMPGGSGSSRQAGGDQARQSEIYRVEAALREHGLDVREAAVR